MTVQPKPLPETNLPPLRQVGKPLRRVDASSLHASASSLCEEGGERQGVLQSDEQAEVGGAS